MPVHDIRRRHRELGRLRMGTKGDKGQPVKLETWRLTSPSLELLADAAERWGGTVGEWEQGYELITETDSLPVLVPEQDLEANQWYTLYSAGGILRRCDGTTEYESDGPCICDRENLEERQCSVTTHLLVVLPQLPDIGVWRLTTHGFNAAAELASGIDILQQFVERGQMPNANLVIEKRTQKKDGKTRHYLVPVLRIPHSLEELGAMTGRAELPSRAFDPETGELIEGSDEGDRAPGPTASAEEKGAPPSHSSADAPLSESEVDETADGAVAASAFDSAIASGDGDSGRAAGHKQAGSTPVVAPPAPEDYAELASTEQWARAARHGLTSGKALLALRDRGVEITSAADITKGQLVELILERTA